VEGKVATAADAVVAKSCGLCEKRTLPSCCAHCFMLQLTHLHLSLLLAHLPSSPPMSRAAWPSGRGGERGVCLVAGVDEDDGEYQIGGVSSRRPGEEGGEEG